MWNKNKNIFISIIIASVLVSSLFGAGAGLIVTTSGIASSPGIKNFLQKIGLPIQEDEIKNNELVTTDTPLPVDEPVTVASAVEKVSPAVVSIVVTKDLPKLERYYYNPFEGNDFFGDSLGNDFLVPGYRQNGTETQEIGGGSGFIITKDGLIVTNKHVVIDEEAGYTVILNDERKFEAKVLAKDPINDLAILKIDGQNLPVVELGDSDKLKPGQTIIAIGNALGEFSNTVSVGVISGLSRSITAAGGSFSEDLTNVIQTDASINPGNSGGPLLNINGQVIGINTAVASGAQGIGFAIPINEVKNTIESVKENGRIIRPWLGVRYVMLNEQIAEDNNLDITEGALIIRGESRTELAVVPGSPADKAGIAENDIILELGEQKINSKNILAKEIMRHQPGEEVKIKLWHKGEEKIIKVKLEEYK